MAIPWAKRASFFVFFFLREMTKFVCWEEAVSPHSSAGLLLPEVFFFLSFHSCLLLLKRKWKLTPVASVLHFFNTSELNSTLKFDRGLCTFDLLHCKALQSAILIVFRPQRVMRKEPQWAMVSVVPSSLRSASLQQNKNYTFCCEDLLFDTVTYPRQYRCTFATMIPWN